MTEKIVKKVKVKNALGLHTRPATVIVQTIGNTKSDVYFTHKKETVNAKSILSILMLAIQKNQTVTITVEGEDATTTMTSLIEVFENRFGERC